MKTLKLSVLVTYVISVSSIVLIVVSLNLLTASFIFIKSVNMIHTLKVTALHQRRKVEGQETK